MKLEHLEMENKINNTMNIAQKKGPISKDLTSLEIDSLGKVTSPSSSFSPSSTNHGLAADPLSDMCSLVQQHPKKYYYLSMYLLTTFFICFTFITIVTCL